MLIAIFLFICAIVFGLISTAVYAVAREEVRKDKDPVTSVSITLTLGLLALLLAAVAGYLIGAR